MLRSILAVTIFLGCVGAEDPIVVKGKILKNADLPKMCHRHEYLKFGAGKAYPEATVYSHVVKCGGDPDCETMIVYHHEYTHSRYAATVITDYDYPEFESVELGVSLGGEVYKHQEGDECPEGYRPYVPPPARFSRLFCKYEHRMCATREKIGEPFKTKDAYFCMKKCIAEPMCSAVAYINNKAIKNRCQLLEGHCRNEDLRHFHTGEHYTRLLLTEKDCPELTPFCADGDQKVISVEYGSIKEDPTVSCPDNHVLSRCECHAGNFRAECKGVRMAFDGKSCTALRETMPKYMRAVACCRPVGKNERALVVSAPDKKSLEGGQVTYEHHGIITGCPPDMHVVGCTGFKLSALYTWEEFTVDEVGRTCRASRLVGGSAAVQAVCIGSNEMGAVRSGQCLENEKEVLSTDTPAASCQSGSFVSQCSCEVVSGAGFCAGTVVSADATKCQAYGSADGVTVMAKVCCAPLGEKEVAVVMSKPESLTPEVKTDQLYRAPYVLCPMTTQLVSCSLYSSVEGQRAYVEGSRCWATWKCTNCGIQAVCKNTQFEPEEPWKCDEGDKEVVSRGSTAIYYREAYATCPSGTFVTKCTCKPVTEGDVCDYVGLKRVDLCWVWSSNSARVLKARGCCRVKKEDEVIYNVKPADKFWDSYVVAPHVTCPKDSRVVSCILHTKPPSLSLHERALVEGTKCFTASSCTSCSVFAVCSKTIEKITFDKRECTDDETEVVSSGVATGSGKNPPFTIATCPSGHWLTHCQCLPQSEDGLCDAARISPNGRKCMARGTVGGTKAKGCCTRVSGRVKFEAVTYPRSILKEMRRTIPMRTTPYFRRSPKVGCPEGTSLVTCLFDSAGSNPTVVRVPYTVAGTEKCFSGPECTECAIIAICKGLKTPVQKFSCAKSEKEVIGPEVYHSQEPSRATCEEGYYVRSCACEAVTSYEALSHYCLGEIATLDGRTCNVYRQYAVSSGLVKARACCAKLRTNEDVFGISDPTRLLTETLKPNYEGRGVFVECPPKTTLVECYLKIEEPDVYGKERVEYLKTLRDIAIRIDDRCEAPFKCRECAISAVCKGPKKLVARLRWYNLPKAAF